MHVDQSLDPRERGEWLRNRSPVKAPRRLTKDQWKQRIQESNLPGRFIQPDDLGKALWTETDLGVFSNPLDAYRAGKNLLIQAEDFDRAALLAVQVLKTAIGTGLLGYYLEAYVLIDRWFRHGITSVYNGYFLGDLLRYVDFLLIDSVGMERTPEPAHYALGDALHFRHVGGRPIILAAAADDEILCSRYGPHFHQIFLSQRAVKDWPYAVGSQTVRVRA